nr:DUF255 domain-containing protein [candidate division Zixibacteria bacterium]
MKRLMMATMTLVLAFSLVSAQEKAKVEEKGEREKSEKATEIKWVRYDEGLKQARAESHHVLINFTTSWCGWCKKMNKTTFMEPEVVDIISKKFVAVKVDGDSKEILDVDGYKIAERDLARSEYRVTGYPAYWFLKPNGEKLGVLPGYQDADRFMEVLFYMSENLYDKMTFEEYMKSGGRKAHGKS